MIICLFRSQAKAAVDSVPAQCEDGSEAVAQKLEQLLREQELTFSDDSSTVVDQTGENIQENSMLYNGSEDTDVDDKNMFKFRKENKKKSRKGQLNFLFKFDHIVSFYDKRDSPIL